MEEQVNVLLRVGATRQGKTSYAIDLGGSPLRQKKLPARNGGQRLRMEDN